MITIHKRDIIETHEDMIKSKSLVEGQDINMAPTHFNAAIGSLSFHHVHENVSRYGKYSPEVLNWNRTCLHQPIVADSRLSTTLT